MNLHIVGAAQLHFCHAESSLTPPTFGRGQNPEGSGPHASLEDPG
jgi:hypothetical protein